jgi:hypothetical protein
VCHPAGDPIRLDEAPRYRVTLLAGAQATPEGVAHRVSTGVAAGAAADGEPASALIRWDEVLQALAAEVGEPEGVRTIVFDLVVAVEADSYRVCRLDADPGGDAMNLARVIETALGPDLDIPSIKSVATDGSPSRWYPDLRALAEDAALILDALGSR